MKALYLVDKRKVEMRDIPVPEVKAGEVLVKVMHCGVCGSDVHYYKEGAIGDFVVKEPMILGHECAGEIVELGEGVTELNVGDKVALEPGIPCGKCEYCKSGKYNLCPDVKFMATPPIDGAFCEYVSYPAEFCFKLPDNMDTIDGAMIEPLNCGFHATQRVGAHVGQTAVIMGDGCIGLCVLTALHASGVNDVYLFGKHEKRLAMAKKMGATAVFNISEVDPVKKINEISNGRGMDLVFELTGSVSGTQVCIPMAARGGKIMLMGQGANAYTEINIDGIIVKELDVMGNFRYANLYPTVINAVSTQDLKIKEMITDIYKFEDVEKALEYSVTNKADTVKMIIEF